MKPRTELHALCAAPMLPELQLWRAVVSRAVFDVQQGSLAQARDVLKWIDTEDFERVVVWAGFELDQGEIAAEALRRTFSERFEKIGDAKPEPIMNLLEDQAQCEGAVSPPVEVHPIQKALLALIFMARDIRRAKKSSQSRRARRASSVGASYEHAAATMMGRSA
jgi:hypothetical protein